MMRVALERLIHWLAPDYRRHWAEAMTAEMAVIESKRDAVVFAGGCVIACCRFRLERQNSGQTTGSIPVNDRFAILTFSSGLLAGLIGLTYLLVSGASLMMVMVNGGAIVIGISLALAFKPGLQTANAAVSRIALIAAFILLGTAIFGYPIEEAKRWLLIGPFFVQTSLILLPLVAIGFARIQNLQTMCAIVIAALAMATQPDRAMAAMLFVVVAVVSLSSPSKLTFSTALLCALAFAATLLLPDRLPAVPFVDHILWTAFDISRWAGLMLWAGCILLVCPILLVAAKERTLEQYAFASCWLTLITAAAIGAYPTPIVGYGASAIIGYFLSLIFVPPASGRRTASDGAPTSLSEGNETIAPLRHKAASLAI